MRLATDEYHDRLQSEIDLDDLLAEVERRPVVRLGLLKARAVVAATAVRRLKMSRRAVAEAMKVSPQIVGRWIAEADAAVAELRRDHVRLTVDLAHVVDPDNATFAA